MKGQYFLKDKKAEVFIRAPRYQDSSGVWRNGGVYPISPTPLWCYAKQNAQTISFAAGIAHVNEESRFFVFSNNAHIAQGALIRYKRTWYTVQRVDTQGDYNGDMFVYADDTAIGERPQSADIKPYDPTKI